MPACVLTKRKQNGVELALVNFAPETSFRKRDAHHGFLVMPTKVI